MDRVFKITNLSTKETFSASENEVKERIYQYFYNIKDFIVINISFNSKGNVTCNGTVIAEIEETYNHLLHKLDFVYDNVFMDGSIRRLYYSALVIDIVKERVVKNRFGHLDSLVSLNYKNIDLSKTYRFYVLNDNDKIGTSKISEHADLVFEIIGTTAYIIVDKHNLFNVKRITNFRAISQ